MDNISRISACKALNELSVPDDVEELNAFHSMQELVSNLDNENKELKDQIQSLHQHLEKEKMKNKDIIPQYKDSVNRLRKNTNILREKMKEIQDQKEIERQDLLDKVLKLLANGANLCFFLKKLEFVENDRTKILNEDINLKRVNLELTNKIQRYERHLSQNEVHNQT